MKKKINFLAKEWKVKIGKDLSGIDKKYQGFEWMFELLKEKKECQKNQQK